MVLHFLYGTYGYATYETQSVYGLTIAEFLGDIELSDEAEDFAKSVFYNRLKSIGDDKIAYILSNVASDYATDDYEYEDLEYELSEGETNIYLISIAIDEKQYSEVIRKFYQMIGTSLNDEDVISYNSLVKFFQEYDKCLDIKHFT
nr:MAG TPA: hypothetical protein [Caudoviricetes sp.]